MASVIRNAAGAIDAHSVMEVVGEYRRDLTSCPKLAVLLTSPLGVIGLLSRLVIKLREWFFLIGDEDHSSFLLNIPPDDASEMLPEDQFEGLCRFKPSSPSCPIVITVCLPQNWPCSLLFHTGPSLFYEKLQSYALDINFSVTPEGIQDLSSDTQPPITSERDIFVALKLPYLPPHRRFDQIIFPSPL